MKLLEPFRLKNLMLRNRIVMASMGTNLSSPEGFVTDGLISYYAERAKGGAGLIITELVTIDFPLGNGVERQLSIDDDKYIPGLRKLTEQIHRHGSKIFIQLNHAGSRAKPEITGIPFPVSASDVPSCIVKVEPKPLTSEEIGKLIHSFGQAAGRVKEAGFDGIDLHFAHGYLLCQFLSSLTNKRTDEYGGSLENRARFPIEVLEECRRVVGKNFPITAKVTGHQYVSGGITIRETKAFSRLLEERGIDGIQVSGGDPESADHFPVPPSHIKRGCYVKLAEMIKEKVHVPVIAVGRINTIILANSILESGKADLVAMGRAFLADPDFPRKAQEGKLREIRKCIGCNQGCRGRDKTKYLVIGCVLNPRVGKEKDQTEIIRAKTPKEVLVIGGGPGGMEAARVAALKGHKVTLVEEKKGLGGNLRIASKPPGRRGFGELIQWYRLQLRKLGVRLLLERKADPDLIQTLNPEAIIVAAGSRPLIPKIKGLQTARMVSASEILEKRIPTGKKIVIIGGGGVGLETADFLATQGKRVVVIEQLSEVGRDLEGSTKKVLMRRLGKNQVEILTGIKIDRVKGSKIVIRSNGDSREIRVAWPIVNATGVEANKTVFLALKKIRGKRDFDIYEIGDCATPRQIREAIFEGYMISKNI